MHCIKSNKKIKLCLNEQNINLVNKIHYTLLNLSRDALIWIISCRLHCINLSYSLKTGNC